MRRLLLAAALLVTTSIAASGPAPANASAPFPKGFLWGTAEAGFQSEPAGSWKSTSTGQPSRRARSRNGVSSRNARPFKDKLSDNVTLFDRRWDRTVIDNRRFDPVFCNTHIGDVEWRSRNERHGFFRA